MKTIFKLCAVLPFFLLACEDDDADLDRDQFLGGYDITTYCETQNPIDTTIVYDTTMFTMQIIVPDPDTNSNTIEIVDLFGAPIDATVSGNTFNFSGMAAGSGTISNNQLNFNFAVGMSTCTAVGIKN